MKKRNKAKAMYPLCISTCKQMLTHYYKERPTELVQWLSLYAESPECDYYKFCTGDANSMGALLMIFWNSDQISGKLQVKQSMMFLQFIL